MGGLFDSHYRKQHLFIISCENDTVFNADIKKLDKLLMDGYTVANMQKITIENVQKLILILYDPDMTWLCLGERINKKQLTIELIEQNFCMIDNVLEKSKRLFKIFYKV